MVGFWNFKSANSAEYVMDFLFFCLPCCCFFDRKFIVGGAVQGVTPLFIFSVTSE
jgi:hypothetical protein